ncbi:beta strand repeat-containing protein [Frigoriglobus tundricola]|uniref:Uncharacterized protein n=1 Tax=Frigoriglobus tundricola TaxID=2774151 RepID=A0A6M5YWX4_9BACT|nr:hypothetical protein [Frigoriglobus tundricola]QJW97713.1 hypothetical protein FTUN_5291 [Frigoriglobus tundricola]
MRLSQFLSRLTRPTSPIRRPNRPKAPSSRPRLEVLEGRDVPATVSWINASGGDWDTASNWSTGAVPGASDDAVLSVTGNVTVTHSTGAADAVRSISGTDALVLSGGSLSVSSNSDYTGAVTLSGATLTGGGNLELDGALTWTGGTMSGTGTTLATGTVLLNPTTQFFQPALILDGRTFDNAKAATWVGGNVSTRDGAVFDNLAGATFTVQTDSTFDSNSGQQGTFQNEGTVTKSLTIGTTDFNTLFDNTGTVTVKTGTLDLNGGGNATGSFKVSSGATLGFTQDQYTLGAASQVTGAGTVQFLDNAFFGGSVYNLNGSFTPSKTVISGGTVNFDANTKLATLTFTGGTLSGTANLTVTGPLNWTGGTMSGSGTTLSKGALLIETTSATPSLSGRTFDNDGSAILTGSGTLTIVSGALFDNAKGATFNVQGDAVIGDGSDTGTFDNAGTFEKTLTTGTTNLEAVFNNSGTVGVQTGTLALAGGGTGSGAFAVSSGAVLAFSGDTDTLSPASHVTGAGTVAFQGGTVNLEGAFAPANTDITGGTVNVTTNLSLADLTMSGGTLTGPSTVTVTGPLDWTGGTMSGSGTTVAAGGLTIDTTVGGNPGLSARTFRNAQVGTLVGNGGTFAVSNSGTFDNAAGGALTIQGSVSFGAAFFQGPGTVQNEGTLNLSGTGTTVTVNEPFTTNGTVNLGGNTLNTSGTYTQTGGTTNLQGGTLTAGGTGVILQAPASLIGPGTVNGNVANSGLVDPGSAGAPGQLTINGSYSQSGTGTLQIQLGGTTPGTGGYDQLVVNGAVALDGTLSVALVNGFVPQSGQQFSFLTDSSESGTFATDLFPVGVNFQVTYGPNGVTLTAI